MGCQETRSLLGLPWGQVRVGRVCFCSAPKRDSSKGWLGREIEGIVEVGGDHQERILSNTWKTNSQDFYPKGSNDTSTMSSLCLHSHRERPGMASSPQLDLQGSMWEIVHFLFTYPGPMRFPLQLTDWLERYYGIKMKTLVFFLFLQTWYLFRMRAFLRFLRKSFF